MKHSTSFQKSTLQKHTLKAVFSKTLGLCSAAIATILLPALSGQAIEFPQTGDRGAPERTSGGGTRGDRCAADIDKSIQAIVPKNNVSTFAQPQAKLWIHIPAELTNHTAEVFVQHSKTHEAVYEQQINLPQQEQDSLIELSLPTTRKSGAPLLEDNQNYLWEFAIICDTNDRTRDHYTQGFLHKKTDNEALQLEFEEIKQSLDLPIAGPDDMAIELYAGAELWQETLSVAISANSYRSHFWQELLKSVDLEDLSAPQHGRSLVRSMQRLSLPQAEQ